MSTVIYALVPLVAMVSAIRIAHSIGRFQGRQAALDVQQVRELHEAAAHAVGRDFSRQAQA